MPPGSQVISPVVLEWEKHDYIKNAGLRGELAQVPTPDKITRRDVLANTDILAPLIATLGPLFQYIIVKSNGSTRRSVWCLFEVTLNTKNLWVVIL